MADLERETMVCLYLRCSFACLWQFIYGCVQYSVGGSAIVWQTLYLAAVMKAIDNQCFGTNYMKQKNNYLSLLSGIVLTILAISGLYKE